MSSDSCQASRKKKYASKAEADAAIDHVSRANNQRAILYSYECPYCQYWHMTSKPSEQAGSREWKYLKHPKSRKSR
jgi:hypothetical protein